MVEASTHESYARDEAAEGSSDRGFGLVFAAFFAIIAAIVAWRGGVWWIWAGAAGAMLVIALVVPRMLSPLNRLWTAFAMLLYRVVSPITMGLVFFLVVTPIGLFLRAWGKDLLRLKRDPTAPSYWIARNPPGPAPETMRDQY